MKKRFIVFGLALFSSAAALAQNDLKTVATVTLAKTEQISVKMLRVRVEQMEAALGRVLNADERREVLDAMINERLALQAAEM